MSGHPAELWESDGGRIRCLLCPHACRIAPGAVGVCGVRRNEDGALIALTYGRVSSVAVDPIEKKPVFHFHPGTTALSLGSVGCTMKCGHCQNWRISRGGADDAVLSELAAAEAVALAGQYGCAGIAFTYNEPVIWAEYVRDTGIAARERGLYTVMVTNGYITQAGLDHLAPALDVWRVDVKAMTDEAARRLCGIPSAAPVLRMAERAMHVHGLHVEVVTNVIPGVNDDEAQLTDLAVWIADALGPDVPWHITRFFPYLEFTDVPPTPLATLRRTREIGHDAGLRYVYLGNVDEPGGEDTVCPVCGALAVRRNGFAVLDDRVRDGACPRCGEALGIIG
ncbi:MAG: AmmeMemoRadiSam system radical SAM enzyme [Coriobacteriia bacterium]|nr:AmmeMemoRadiSam system radical SAM enzyme [Coriobacteriia bacterium]